MHDSLEKKMKKISSRIEPGSKKELPTAQNRFDQRPLKHAFLPLHHENRGIHRQFFLLLNPSGNRPTS
jgi:hypothetical protein